MSIKSKFLIRTMLKFLVIFVIFIDIGITRESCPKFIMCETSQKPNSCPQNKFYRENAKVHGCCPGCETLSGIDESCNSTADCQPGLTCENSTKCVKDESQACEFYKRYDFLLNKTKYWNPLCLSDGTYAPKQCKGEKMAGKCFCVNKMGKRVFGEENWSKAENMTCACSRRVENAKKIRAKVSLHCNHLGNFEPLQCNEEVCWCANPTSGVPYTIMVPIQMIISLPCYNREAVGAQYYRQCDSANQMQELAKSLLWNHGTIEIISTSPKCNLDGSYHRVQVFREKNRCVFIDNSYLTEATELSNANCNCAFDKHVALLQQLDFLHDCHSNGNYKSRQTWNGKVYCIDEDGFHYSDDSMDCPDTS